MHGIRYLPAALLAVLLAVAPAAAAVVLRVGVDDLTDKATAIVVGKVTSVEARWTTDHRTINTYVTIRVRKALKGAVDREVVVTCPGGRVGDDLLHVSGVPTFEKKERVLVFLWKNKNGDLLPLGLNQGKFHIHLDAKSGKVMASNSLEGLTFALRPGQSASSAATPDSMPLSDLEQKIEDRIVKTAATPSGSGGTNPQKTDKGSSGSSSSGSTGSTPGSSASSGATGSGTASPPADGSSGSGTASPPASGSSGSKTASPPASGSSGSKTESPPQSGSSGSDTSTPPTSGSSTGDQATPQEPSGGASSSPKKKTPPAPKGP